MGSFAFIAGLSIVVFAIMIWAWGLESTVYFILYDTILDPLLWSCCFAVLLWHHLTGRAGDPH